MKKNLQVGIWRWGTVGKNMGLVLSKICWILMSRIRMEWRMGRGVRINRDSRVQSRAKVVKISKLEVG